MTTRQSAYISRFQMIRPRYQVPQEDLLKWLASAHARSDVAANSDARAKTPTSTVELNAETERMLELFNRIGCKPDKIATRGTDVEDVVSYEHPRSRVYALSKEQPNGADIEQRTKVFEEIADRILEEFYPESASAPDHLVHVSCTGYISPSAAQKIVDLRHWNETTAVTHNYHMGCYAAFPAVRQAIAFVAAEPSSTIDIVHTEICSLHLNPLDHRPEQMVVQSLFADGYIKYSVTEQPEVGPSLKILAPIQEFIIPNTGKLMSWQPASWGMSMTLAKEVPAAAASHVERFLSMLLMKADLTLEGAQQSAVFAIHPGGPLIIDSIQDLLRLQDHQVAHSKGVLRDYGNMSSATLPHIWQRLLNDSKVVDGQVIVSLAFGPGLTIFGSVLRKIAKREELG
jgi:predicted naringenin-chalcone synthase